MASISVCMIVKNEEKCLAGCLDGLKQIADEIIIVDTGSDDRTKRIAADYTDKIYDFEWTDDFSQARNFAFSKASMDYIYTADADEVLDSENIKRFKLLKAALLPEIEIVNMTYVNRMENNTVYNFEKELRPKLYKRMRQFQWVDAVHETVRVEPVTFTSDIEILHTAHGNHSARDFNLLKKTFEKSGTLSEKLIDMYAKELFICGSDKDFLEAGSVFESLYKSARNGETLVKILCVLARIYRLKDDKDNFFNACLKVNCKFAVCEIFNELGEYFYSKNDFENAMGWFLNSLDGESELDIRSSGEIPKGRLADCCNALYKQTGNDEFKRLCEEYKTADFSK